MNYYDPMKQFNPLVADFINTMDKANNQFNLTGCNTISNFVISSYEESADENN